MSPREDSAATEMKIATWNINGIRARIDTATTWVKEAAPDVLCLQEIKCVDEGFPADVFESLGYNAAVHGQKGFNGVAILSKFPLSDVKRGLPGDSDDGQARFIEATISFPTCAIAVASIYLPNGNPVGTEKFSYKLAWLKRLYTHAATLMALEQPLVLAGDFNVIPEAVDARYPEQWTRDALFQPESRGLYRSLKNIGMTDALRICRPEPGVYTFWDYQAGSWQKNNGIRIDHLLLSPQAADRIVTAGVDKHTRGWEKPSDHVPVWADVAIP